MTTRLEAWLEGRHAGTFVFAEHTHTAFIYDDSAPETPISLSLPRDGGGVKRAAGNFVENLLPDHAATRERMAEAYGAASAGTYDLLLSAGGDVAGGLVLTAEGQEPQTALRELSPADDDGIASRIAAIKRDPDDWVPDERRARFSLAGTQGKFTLAEIDDEYYWSNESMPSTHILKPGRQKLRSLEAAEVATLALANRVGIVAPHAEVREFITQSAFVIERFDRVRTPDGVHRLHAEDLAQALGEPPKDKYDVTAAAIIRLLRRVDASGDLIRDFLRQMAFNVLIGNADAHAKNYSVMLRPEGVELAPLYDAVPIALYPQFDQDLAMKIGSAEYSAGARPAEWRKLARNVGIDEDETIGIVQDLAGQVGEHSAGAWDTLDLDQTSALEEIINRNVDAILDQPAKSRSTKSPTASGAQGHRPAGRRDGGQFTEKRHSDPEITLGD